MGIYECNEEYVRKTLYEDGYESGKAAERNKMILVTVNSAMRNFNLSLEEACKGLGVEIEAYEHAKAALEADCQKENS